MVLSGEDLDIVWLNEAQDSNGNSMYRIYFTGSRDRGIKFSSPELIAQSQNPIRSLEGAVDGNGNLYIAWIEDVVGSLSTKYIIHLARTSGAKGLPSPEKKSFARLADLDGDGLSDVVAGAPPDGVFTDLNSRGTVYIFMASSIKNLASGSNGGQTDISTDQADLTLSGEASGDLFGHSVGRGGDINGDGYGDIIVGAPYASGNGKIYLYYGGPEGGLSGGGFTGSEGSMSGGSSTGSGSISGGDSTSSGGLTGSSVSSGGSSTGPDVIIYGPEEADSALTAYKAGFSVAMAGDLNGDGFGDFIIGAPEGSSGIPDTGVAYVFFGGPLLGRKDGYPLHISVSRADLILTGENTGDEFGWSVAGVGDFNGDGFDDVAVGAPMSRGIGGQSPGIGTVYIYFGGRSMDARPDVKISAMAGGSMVGYSISGGDVNRDGFGDIVIGAPYGDDNRCGGTDTICMDSGAVYVVYGSPISQRVDENGYEGTYIGQGSGSGQDTAGPVEIELDGASDTSGSYPVTTIHGYWDYEHLGYVVRYAGDVNNDGYGDIIAGTLYQGSHTDYTGAAYIYLGSSWSSGSSVAPGVRDVYLPDITLQGEGQQDAIGGSDRFGSAVARIGDVNGDGISDIAVGAPLYDAQSGTSIIPDAGRVYLYYGRQDWGSGDIIPSSQASITLTGVGPR